jgi:uncharacterized protein
MRPFLRAEWRHVAMLNYVVDAECLSQFVPSGTELDLWQGRAYVSAVGFLFRDTTVLGLPIPFHRDFEEVNLRFYVRRRASEGWRRGVVFVREIVPRAAIAFTARVLYNEKYVALPMGHRLGGPDSSCARSVAYHWRFGGRDLGLEVTIAGTPVPPAAGSEEEFVIEHYWGYTAQRDGGTVEYKVEHPPWVITPAAEARLHGDVARFYGPPFEEALRQTPVSAFLAGGSRVTVYRGRRLP